MWAICELRNAEAPAVAIVANRSESFLLDMSARQELDDLTVSDALPDRSSLEQVLNRMLQVTDSPLIALIGNSDLLFDPELTQRIAKAASTVSDPEKVAVVTGKGVDLWGNHFSGLYASLAPHLPFCRSPVPVVDSASDLCIISRSHLSQLLSGPLPTDLPGLAGWAVLEGYLDGRVSYFSPYLAAGIDGHELTRYDGEYRQVVSDLIGGRVTQALLPCLEGELQLGMSPPEPAEQRQWRMSPPVDLERQIRDTISKHCARMRLSIVSRTQFKRPYLLRRMLTSISRWRREDMDVEIVLSTDIDREKADAALAGLRADFPALSLSLAWNGDRLEKSRVRNLLGGLSAAKHDYVAFIDDDDHVHFQAFSCIALTRFMGSMPILMMNTELRNEEWVEGTNGRWALESTNFHHNYPGSGWRTVFQGVNTLPICAAVLPREWAVQTVEQFDFRHDYSEDFTLWLLLLGAPDLPLILDIPRPFCVVSIRNDGTNTVTENDRSRWVRDISMFLHDLHVEHPLSGEGRLQAAVMRKPAQVNSEPQRTDGTSRLRRELAVLRAENEELRLRLVPDPQPQPQSDEVPPKETVKKFRRFLG